MRWVLIPLLLAGCTADVARAPTKAERAARASEHVGKAPAVKWHSISGNQLLVMDVPVTDGYGSTERQQCFVYRDQEFKTASITCPSREVVLTP